MQVCCLFILVLFPFMQMRIIVEELDPLPQVYCKVFSVDSELFKGEVLVVYYRE